MKSRNKTVPPSADVPPPFEHISDPVARVMEDLRKKLSAK